jgi:hypothetical protein
VTATPIDGRTMMRLVRYVETDNDGRFLLDHLELGRYGVFAMKEESGYPDLGASLYSNDIFPTVSISTASPAVSVRIQLGPKAGLIQGFSPYSRQYSRQKSSYGTAIDRRRPERSRRFGGDWPLSLALYALRKARCATHRSFLKQSAPRVATQAKGSVVSC